MDGGIVDNQGIESVILSEKRREKEEMMILDSETATLPTAKIECEKCGNKKAYWIIRQTRAADEPETRIYRCTKCENTWREY